jgi:hypothetical protein
MGDKRFKFQVGQLLLYGICCSFSAVKSYMRMYLRTGSINVVQYVR